MYKHQLRCAKMFSRLKLHQEIPILLAQLIVTIEKISLFG